MTPLPDEPFIPEDPLLMDPALNPLGAPPLAVPLEGEPPVAPVLPPPPALMGSAMLDPLTGMPMPDPIGLMEPLPEPVVEEEEVYGPTPPAWYRKPPKPRLQDVIEDAERERERHDLRISLAMDMLARLNLEGFGMFERDKEAVKTGEIEGFYDTSLRDEHDAAVAHISSMEWAAESPFRNTIDQEEADAKEDLIHYLWEVWQRQHARAGNASLKIAMPDVLMKYGQLVGYAVIDPADEECGLRMQLLDPATCFPVHEGHRGLSAMYRIYSATAAQVIGNFGDPEGKVERKVKKIVGAADGSGGTWDRNWEGEVIEYWDRNWVLVAFEGEQILVREHGYARVPFVVTYGGFGQQNFTNTRDVYVHGEGEIWNRPGYGVNGFNPREDDMGRISQPFLARRTRQHDIGEAVAGRFLTMFRRAMKPSLIIKQSLISGELNDIEIDFAEEGQTKIGADDDILPLPNLPTPEVIQPIMQLLAEGKATSMATGIMMGQSPHSQASGSAIDILAQTGFARWSPIVLGIQCFLAEMCELFLELYRDWGLLLGMEPSIGTLYVPRRNPNPRAGESPVHEVTPDLLRRTGIRAQVMLYKFNVASLAATAQGLMVLKAMGIMPKIDAIKIVGFSADPQGVLRRKEEEDLADVPEVKQEATLRRLVKEAQDAEMRGDFESYEERMGKAIFIAGMMMNKPMFGQGGGGAGAPPMPPTMPPGTAPMDLGRDPNTGQPMPMPPPGTPVSEALPEIGVQGLNTAQLGIPIGQQGGRPKGM